MKIAIHNRKGSFSDRWIFYCKENNIDYIKVNAYDTDIIEQIKDCDIFMWHHHHGICSDVNFAKQLLFSLEQSGKTVFPNFNSGWHFDDKLGQKYLFEALGIPVAPSYAFYTEKDALSWAKNTTYPKIFKLRGGAGSSNVYMVKTYKETKKHIKKIFSKGYAAINKKGIFIDHVKKFFKGKSSLKNVIKSFALLFINRNNQDQLPVQKGYVYFQDFIENDGFDYRMIVCKDKCISFVRYCREGDFRASGANNKSGKPELFPKDVVKLSFEIADKLKSQSSAFDFVREKNTGKLYLIENSYAYGPDADQFDYGYFDRNGDWHDKKFNGIDWIISNVIENFKTKNKS